MNSISEEVLGLFVGKPKPLHQTPQTSAIIKTSVDSIKVYQDHIQGDESQLCIGDIFELGSTRIQITEPRNPCATIDARYEFRGVLKEILNSRKYGWFYRILESGIVKRGDGLNLVERPFPDFNLDKLIFELRQSGTDRDFLKRIYHCPALSTHYKKSLEKFSN